MRKQRRGEVVVTEPCLDVLRKVAYTVVLNDDLAAKLLTPFGDVEPEVSTPNPYPDGLGQTSVVRGLWPKNVGGLTVEHHVLRPRQGQDILDRPNLFPIPLEKWGASCIDRPGGADGDPAHNGCYADSPGYSLPFGGDTAELSVALGEQSAAEDRKNSDKRQRRLWPPGGHQEQVDHAEPETRDKEERLARILADSPNPPLAASLDEPT